MLWASPFHIAEGIPYILNSGGMKPDNKHMTQYLTEILKTDIL